MEYDSVKPPWLRMQWYTSAPSVKDTDISGCPITGEWKEQRNVEIEVLKESIHPFDKTPLWDLAKRITNPFELISTSSSRLKLPKSTCCIHPLSRSFFKMIEMLQQMQFFERHKDVKLKSLHICEGPGGFIEAFHYIAQNKKRLIQNSFGITLKSTHQMIPGWRRATRFLQKHPNIQLIYGPNKTGDIYELENQAACVESVGKTGATLVTADGGFDFSEDFNAQEKNILRLLVNSAIIILECVAIDGDAVLKLFDCNSQTTRDFIALLASCFQSWTLYKPVTSRPCNSEWYFIGRGAHRERTNVLSVLKRVRDGFLENPQQTYTNLLQVNPINDLLIQLQEDRCAVQTAALKEVLSFCNKKDTISHEAMWEKQREPSIHWCSVFKMPSEFKTMLV